MSGRSNDAFPLKVGDDILLRLPKLEDAKLVNGVVRENLDRLKLWMPWAVDDYSPAHARQWIQQTLDEKARTGQFNLLIMVGGNFAGTIGIHGLDAVNRNTAIGYWIDAKHEGRGIITKCCIALIDHVFHAMKLHRVQINCNVENARSRAIPERLGFTLEGTLRESEFLNGQYRNWAVYGLLADEWGR